MQNQKIYFLKQDWLYFFTDKNNKLPSLYALYKNKRKIV